MTNKRGGNMIDKIISYESGELSEADTIELFQELINTGQAWTLQGHYGRTAHALIEAGVCTRPSAKYHETYIA